VPRSLAWQMHVYGDATEDLPGGCERYGLAAHVFPWTDAARDAAYLVRPERYVALAFADQRKAAPGAAGERLGLRFGRAKASR